MAITVKGGYKCGYCHKFFTSPVEADSCKDAHELIYIALSKEDLNRLIIFIFTKEEELLKDSIVERLQNYLKGTFTLDEGKKDVTKS